MSLTIIIVNWNSGGFLRKCIKSILKERGLNFEGFVVDNASTDNSLKDIPKRFKIVRNDQNLGFSKACNQALKKAKGRYVLLLNPDTVVLKNSLKGMISFLDEHKDIGVLGCKLLNSDKTVQPSCHAFLTLPHVFFEVSQLDYLFPKNKFFIKLFRPFNRLKLFINYSTPNKPVEVDSVMGSCYMIRKEALKKTGLLDENFFLYHEEMELSYRMWKKGFKVMFYPYSSILHYGRHSTRQVPNIVYFERCKSILHFFKKHKRNNFKILKFVMLFSLLINSFSLPFKKSFKEALAYRFKVLRLLI